MRRGFVGKVMKLLSLGLGAFAPSQKYQRGSREGSALQKKEDRLRQGIKGGES